MTPTLTTQAPCMRNAITICAVALLMLTALETSAASHQQSVDREHMDTPYPNMPKIAPIGVRIGQHLPIPESAKGAPIDPAKGYRLEELGKGLYMITDNAYQSMFMVYDTGVIVVDAPPAYAAHIVNGIREKTDKPITHLIYSHSHVDHIAGAKSLGGVPTIIAHEETKRLLARARTRIGPCQP
jgi:hypothetical protein